MQTGNVSGVWSGAVGQCQKDYVAVGEKCYSVPGLASGFNFWTSSEVCSYQKGHLFHVEDISEWLQLNTFLVETLSTRPIAFGLR